MGVSKVFLKTKDFAVSGEPFELVLDEKTQMLVTRPQPAQPEAYYHSETYISHSDSRDGVVNRLYQLVKRYALKQKLHFVKQFLGPSASILDVGAGTGDFVLGALNRDWNAFGVEPSERARKHAAAKGVPLYSGLNGLADRKFEIITLWHVLEHLPGLETQIIQILSKLEDNGTLILALPNFKSWDAGYYNKYWAAFDVPRHLWHFSQQSVAMIFKAHGFHIIAKHPMLFDAFYIALLSEKYKTGSFNPIRAFLAGLYSNLRAWQNGEYSSLIYVLQQK